MGNEGLYYINQLIDYDNKYVLTRQQWCESIGKSIKSKIPLIFNIIRETVKKILEDVISGNIIEQQSCTQRHYFESSTKDTKNKEFIILEENNESLCYRIINKTKETWKLEH